MVVLGEASGRARSASRRAASSCASFELIYFARPDSYMLGRNLYEARRRMGEALAREAPADVDLVMPVPDTGAPAAAGYAEASGIPYREGMVRNRYAGRTFIQPSNGLRQRGVTGQAVRAARAGARPSAWSWSTTPSCAARHTRQIVGLLRRAGAREVHLRISAPPIFNPCFYGIDTQIETELIAASKSLEEIREFVDADSLSYLSIGGVLDALDLPRERFCFACFDGNYPVPVPYDVANHKLLLEREELVGLADRSTRRRVLEGRRRRRRRRARRRAVRCAQSRSGQLPGEFGSSIAAVPPGMRDRCVVTSTDGVERRRDRAPPGSLSTPIGQDLVAMCADDVVCHGAAPAYFLDYIAVGGSMLERVARAGGGVADACEQIGCELFGGETAEHPGVMADDDFDLAGFCVGFVEREDLIDASRLRRTATRSLVLRSSGLHSNGFSLVRRLVDDGKLPLTDELLTPTRLYAGTVLDAD